MPKLECDIPARREQVLQFPQVRVELREVFRLIWRKLDQQRTATLRVQNVRYIEKTPRELRGVDQLLVVSNTPPKLQRET